MIPLTHYADKKVGVVGLGKSGMATIEALHAGGAEIYVWDDKQDMASLPPYVHVLALEKWPWSELVKLVLSPGVPYTHPAPHKSVSLAKEYQVPVVGDIDLLYEALPQATYVGITGTNGKSTTTALIAHVLKHAGCEVEVGGNLGTPCLALQPVSANGIYVLECSSYQLDLLHMTHFNVAVWLNLSEDHLDRHGDMAGYQHAKEHIFLQQHMQDVAVIAVDDSYSEALALRYGAQCNVVPVSARKVLESGVYTLDGIIHDTLNHHEGDIGDVPALRGQHNWQNASAVYAACASLGVSHATIIEAMHTFPGLPHRMQWVGAIHHVGYVNDSKATNADAAEKSLRTYDHIFWLAGGVAKEGGITSLQPYFSKMKHAYLYGEAKHLFAHTLDAYVPFTLCETMEDAFALAHEAAQEESGEATVLLAPACASFDQFANFEQRGDRFVALVNAQKELSDGV